MKKVQLYSAQSYKAQLYMKNRRLKAEGILIDKFQKINLNQQ